jgi:P27 family predicted phage terminase small subunit
MSRKTTAPHPPEHLDDEARRKWAEVYPILESRGDLDAVILDGLTAYCTAWSQWKAATVKVDELGSVIKSAGGFAIVSPFVTVAAQAERRLRQWAGELKLTPKSKAKGTRAANPSTAKAGKTTNPLEKLRIAQ